MNSIMLSQKSQKKARTHFLKLFVSIIAVFALFPDLNATAAYDISNFAGGGVTPGDGGTPTAAVVSAPAGIFQDALNNTYIADTNNHRIRMIWGAASNGTYTQGRIYTIAGTGSAGFSGDGGLATTALLNTPRSVKVDNAGNIYVADFNNNRIRKFTLGGNISTFAGGGATPGDSGIPTAAVVNSPSQVFLDALNNIYIADTNNHRIRMIWGASSNGTYTQGNIYTIAGTGSAGFSGNGGAATSALLSSPRGVQVDSIGNIYIADYGNNCIRQFTLGGTISTIAGIGGSAGFSGDGSAATSGLLNGPTGFFIDALRNIYIADQANNRIRMVWQAASNGTYTQGRIYTIAGGGTNTGATYSGSPTSVQFSTNSPAGVFVNAAGSIFIADSNKNCIRMFTLGGNISTVAGTGTAGITGDGGSAASAQITNPQNVFGDSSNNIYIAEFGARIRKFTVGGTISTIAGTGTQGFNGDGISATSAQIRPFSVYVDSSNNVYIADGSNNRIRKFTVGGTISTIAGTGSTTYLGDSALATNAVLNAPTNFCLDSAGNVYIADQNNHRIRMVWQAASNGVYTQGRIYTVAGTGNATYNGDGIAATLASVNSPGGVFADNSSNIFIADCQNHRIRKFSVGGTISTIAGNGNTGYSGDGGPATAAVMNLPQDVFKDSSNKIYVADYFGNYIRMFTEGGTISTIAGNGNSTYNGDGISATSAQLKPFGIYVDNSQNVYVAEWGNNNRIRKFSVGGTISTIAGNGTTTYTGDGGLATAASFSGLRQVCTDRLGNLYIAESSNNRIRKITTSTGIVSTIVSGLNNPFGVFVDSSDNLYVANFGNNTIGKYNSTTGSVVNASFISGLNQPYGVFVDNAGIIYVGNYGNSTLGKYNSTTGSVINASFISGLSGPSGVCVDNAGNIYVTSSASNSLRKYSSAGTSINANLISGISNPNGVILDSSGNVYVVDTGNSCIKRLSASDSSVSTITSGLSSPYGLCLDGFNNVYVSNSGNSTIRKLLAKLTYTVSPGSSQNISGTASTAYVTGGGTAVMPPSNSVDNVEVNNGILQISASENIIFNASGSNTAIVEVTSNADVGVLTFTSDGTIQVDKGKTAVLSQLPTGSRTMKIAPGAGSSGSSILQATTDLSASSVPVNVTSGVTLHVANNTAKLPAGGTTVDNGGILQLGDYSSGTAINPISGAIPGSAASISGTVVVPQGVNVSNGTFSATPTLHNNAVIQLGAGATFAQDVAVTS